MTRQSLVEIGCTRGDCLHASTNTCRSAMFKCNQSIGQLYAIQRQYEQAIHHYRSCLKHARALSNRAWLSQVIFQYRNNLIFCLCVSQLTSRQRHATTTTLLMASSVSVQVLREMRICHSKMANFEEALDRQVFLLYSHVNSGCISGSNKNGPWCVCTRNASHSLAQ